MTFWKRKAITIFLLTIPCWTGVIGQTIHCTHADAEKADYEASRLRSWDKLYQSYLRYSGCDDGSIGEGYSDSVSQLLARHWDSFAQALPFLRSNAEFYKFILRHIDQTIANDDLKVIRANAIHFCPTGGNEECRQISNAAEHVLRLDGIVFPAKSKR
jgi:hypothetical protein